MPPATNQAPEHRGRAHLAPRFRRLFEKRTTPLILCALLNAAILAALGLADSFGLALVLLVLWAMVFAAEMPIRQAYLNKMIPSRQRATLLSFASSMGSVGGVVIQPRWGRRRRIQLRASMALGGAIQLISAPLLYLSRRQRAAADIATDAITPPTPPVGQEPMPSTA